MVSKNSKRGSLDSSRESNLYKKLEEKSPKELINLFLEYLKKDFEKSSSEFLHSIKHEGIIIPDEIFTKKLTILEAIVKYLKENLDISYSEIAKLINRDERNIWHTYDVAKKKLKEKFVLKDSEFFIPLSIFSNRKLSILENLVFYLKQEFNLSYHKIAVVIHRNDRTVWTVYQKAKRKYGDK